MYIYNILYEMIVKATQWEVNYYTNEGVLCIPQIFKAGASPSHGLMLYRGHSL